MRTFQLDKLVRDNLVDMMQELGQTVKIRVLDDDEYLKELKRKILEEANEFDPKSPDALKELADIQEAIDQAVQAIGATKDAQIAEQKARADKRGSFQKRLYVETVSMEDDDPWAEYYANEPDRFTEIKESD